MSAIKAKGVRATPGAHRVDPQALKEIQVLLDGAPRRRDLLIEHLHKIQDRYRCISAAHLAALAQEMRLTQNEVFEVATFYHHFDVVREDEAPPPAVTVRVCDSLPCRLAGSDRLLEELRRDCGAGVRVIPAPCVGQCACAPVAVAGKNPIRHATAAAVQDAVARGELHPVLPDYLACSAYREHGGYALLRECVSGGRAAENVIAELEHSGLRGLGGAGFPAGKKWRIVRSQPAPRLMAVNVDEGEPGTFKDRHYLERDPHRFVEGMLIAAWAVEAAEIYIYLRDEYAACREILAMELAALQDDPPCALPPIHLRRGAGAYVCGEESAMIESLEGRRGMPRLRPPYVAQRGLFGRPTLEHNLETLYWVRDILEQGAEKFIAGGRRGRSGLRSFSVSGRVKTPGVYRAPAGITARELIDEYCGGMAQGHELYAYLPGGVSGGMLPASLADIPLDFDTLQEYGCFIGSAALIVLSQRDRAADAARNALRFFADESCGKCTPCRAGTAQMAQLLAAPQWERALLEELAQVMEDGSICGLGQSAPSVARCVLKYFPREIE